MPDLGAEIRRALEGLWSSSAALGSEKVAREFSFSCSACGLPEGGLDMKGLSEFMFMIMLQDFMDAWTFNQKNLMKCCKEFLTGRPADPVLRIQHGRLSGTGARTIGGSGRRAAPGPTRWRALPGAACHLSLSAAGRDRQVNDTELKTCCAAVYQSDFARMLLGDSLHPGGLPLTERLGNLLTLSPLDHVLDVACGRGESAIFLATRFGCRVTGIDFGQTNVADATLRAEAANVATLVQFRTRRRGEARLSRREFRCRPLRVRVLYISQ